MYYNSDLQNHVRAYVRAALRCAKESMDFTFGNDESLSFQLMFLRKEFKNLPQYSECFSAFKKDPEVFYQFEQLTGVGFARSRSVSLETFMLHLPQLLGVNNESFEFDEAFFEIEYKKLEETFYSDKISFEVVVPLQGPKFQDPIKLQEDLEICLVSTKDLKPITPDYDSGKFDTCWAIRTFYELPKTLGDKDNDLEEWKARDKENDDTRGHANQTVEHVVIALRIFCYAVFNFRNIYPATILHRANSLLYPQIVPYRIRYAPEHSFTTIFDGNFGASFLQFWNVYISEEVSSVKSLEIAARRFSFAYERYGWQDKLVDLIVVAEALFLREDDRQKSAPLAQRGSIFLHDDANVQKQISDDFKLAYKLRNQIVHGNDADNEILKISDEYGIEGFVLKIQRYICHSIYKSMLDAIGNSHKLG